MEILTDHSLDSLNTFNINVDGKFYTEVASVEEVREAIRFVRSEGIPLLVLGGGSNILFTRDFPGLVMHVRFPGREVLQESGDEVLVKAGAGEHWDAFVEHCVGSGYSGLENLSLIPGCVGASPVQNIGAYGIEMKDLFESLEYYDFEPTACCALKREIAGSVTATAYSNRT